MSYNIDNVEILSGELFISRDDARYLVQSLNWLPEQCFLDGLDLFSTEEMFSIPRSGDWWSGEGSGSGYDFFLKHVVPRLKGSADLLFIWERGNEIKGLRIQDGTYKEMKVKMVLEEA